MINNNAEITKELKKDFGLSEITGYPRRISEAILPVVDVTPNKINYQASSTRITSGLLTITVPSTKDFLLTNITADFIKDAACDSASGGYAITLNQPNGLPVHNFSVLTLTAQTGAVSLNFNPPIFLPKSSGCNINIGGTFTAGNCARSLSFAGIILDNTGD